MVSQLIFEIAKAASNKEHFFPSSENAEESFFDHFKAIVFRRITEMKKIYWSCPTPPNCICLGKAAYSSNKKKPH